MAISREEAQQMVNALEQAMSARINAFVMSEGQPIKDSIDAHVKLLVTHNETFYDLESRITRVVTEFNDSSKLTVEEISRQQGVLAEQQGRASQALHETQLLDERLKTLGNNLDKYTGERDAMLTQVQDDSAKLQAESMKIRVDVEYEFNTLKANVESWFTAAKAHIDGQGATGGFGKGGPHGGSKSVDKKEIAVWKIPEDVDKASFRHWVDAIDL
jgi:SMC interacting uncharacterized protein involved in chromosome segregation